MRSADLTFYDLSAAKEVNQDQIDNACGNTYTLLPRPSALTYPVNDRWLSGSASAEAYVQQKLNWEKKREEFVRASITDATGRSIPLN
jgi:hypothetical protein